jgi:hypothetical protein
MPRTAITLTAITLDGISPSATDGAAGDVVNGNVVVNNNGRNIFVAVANTSADTEYDVTFVTPGTVGSDALPIGDKIETIAFGVKKWFGPFPVSIFGNSIQIDVEHAALKLQAFSLVAP